MHRPKRVFPACSPGLHRFSAVCARTDYTTTVATEPFLCTDHVTHAPFKIVLLHVISPLPKGRSLTVSSPGVSATLAGRAPRAESRGRCRSRTRPTRRRKAVPHILHPDMRCMEHSNRRAKLLMRCTSTPLTRESESDDANEGAKSKAQDRQSAGGYVYRCQCDKRACLLREVS